MAEIEARQWLNTVNATINTDTNFSPHQLPLRPGSVVMWHEHDATQDDAEKVITLGITRARTLSRAKVQPLQQLRWGQIDSDLNNQRPLTFTVDATRTATWLDRNQLHRVEARYKQRWLPNQDEGSEVIELPHHWQLQATDPPGIPPAPGTPLHLTPVGLPTLQALAPRPRPRP